MKHRGVAPIVVVLILVGVGVAAGTAWYLLNQPAQEVTLSPIGRTPLDFVDHVDFRRTVEYAWFGVGSTKLSFKVFLNDTGLTPQVAILAEVQGSYEMLALIPEVQHGGSFDGPDYNGTIVLVFFTDEEVDAIICDATNMAVGDVRQTYQHHENPASLLQYVKIKKAWKDILFEYFEKLWVLSSELWSLTLQVVVIFLPLASVLWIIWLINAVFKSMKEGDIEPLVNFFYKNYQVAYKIASTIVSIISKIIDLITGPLT